MAGRGPRMTDFEERDYYPPPRHSEPDFGYDTRRRTMTRSPPPRSEARAPAFLRDEARRPEAGPMVLRQREVETFDRHRSPSPVRFQEERLVRRPRSVSSPRRPYEEPEERSRTRFVERETVRSPSIERRRSPSPRFRHMDPPPRGEPLERERIRTRIVDRQRERSSSSSSSSSSSHAPPKHIKGPTIEREVITHYRDIDHGVVKAKPPSPPPAPRPRGRETERETDIDISLSRNRTEVDIYRSNDSRPHRHHDDQLAVRQDNRRRAHSAAPYRPPRDDEAEEITSKIDSRGRHGEAWHGATKNWEIIDVPPGTERVRMDGVGGGGTDTSWTKYSGVRRTKFIPERDSDPAPAPREPERRPRETSTSLTLWDREREVEVDIDRTKYARPPPPPAPPAKDMWTEISKDLVVREAIEHMGYEFEETSQFFYVMSYLRYDDVLQLTEMSEEIRRYRKDRAREIQWEREWRDDWERRHRHQHYQPRPPRGDWDNERVKEREVIYDNRRPYYR